MKRLLAGTAFSVGVAVAIGAAADEPTHNFAGSVQFDYLAVPTTDPGRELTLDGATVELSVKLSMDFSEHVSTNVKTCFGCHGFEVGMAFFDLRVADELNVRAGRFTPAFGEFPLRHDPANHRTSDKPLPYDMGRMLRMRELNLGVLPAPWVDNGVEVNGTHYLGRSQLDYAVYAIMGPKGGADAADFDYTLSRSGATYYADNNSRPTVGARFSTQIGFDATRSIALGASGMYGTYDPANELDFLLLGVDWVLRLEQLFFRAEVLVRRTEMALGDDPASRFKYGPGADGTFDDFFMKEGFYTEVEVPAGRFDLVGRFDGLRRRGNVLVGVPLSANSSVLRYTAALTYRLAGALRLKMSGEYYTFTDFDDEVALHLGIAGPF